MASGTLWIAATTGWRASSAVYRSSERPDCGCRPRSTGTSLLESQARYDIASSRCSLAAQVAGTSAQVSPAKLNLRRARSVDGFMGPYPLASLPSSVTYVAQMGHAGCKYLGTLEY